MKYAAISIYLEPTEMNKTEMVVFEETNIILDFTFTTIS